MVQPPSIILKDFFTLLQGSMPTDEMRTSIARKTLLPINEVRLWLEHLQTIDSNRKQEASKASDTKEKSRGCPGYAAGN